MTSDETRLLDRAIAAVDAASASDDNMLYNLGIDHAKAALEALREAAPARVEPQAPAPAVASFDAVFGKRAHDADGKPLPWAEGSPSDLNAKYLRLRPNELNQHTDLMDTEMRFWPESLQAFVDERVRRVGLCGDVVSVAVADWIRDDRSAAGVPLRREP